MVKLQGETEDGLGGKLSVFGRNGSVRLFSAAAFERFVILLVSSLSRGSDADFFMSQT